MSENMSTFAPGNQLLVIESIELRFLVMKYQKMYEADDKMISLIRDNYDL